ncbi:TPA: hypothetical protein HJM39_005037, partial [Escherichia coli]|nr:hypothetical protein [Escherichia coli]
GQSMLAVFQLVKNTCSRLLQCLQHAAAMRLAFTNHLSFLYQSLRELIM